MDKKSLHQDRVINNPIDPSIGFAFLLSIRERS